MFNKIFFLIILILKLKVTAQSDSLVVISKDISLVSTGIDSSVFRTTYGELDSDMNSQDISSLLQASKDIFTGYAAFHFNSAHFKFRGYNPQNHPVLINGIDLSNLETGEVNRAFWNGLNDLSRFTESNTGLNASRFTFGDVGGNTGINCRASSFRKGMRVSYSNANRVFQNRLSLTHSTGVLQNGWALTVSASCNSGNAQNFPHLYSPGTFVNSFSYFISADKRFNDRHSVSLTGFGAFVEQGLKSNATQAAYDLAGSNYYNSFWGYQNGKVRNSRVTDSHQPVIMLSHLFNFNSSGGITTTAFYTFGHNSISGLNFYDAPNPHPDYYKYLPDYYYQSNPSQADQIACNWRNDVNTRQVNWDQFYFANRKNLYLVNNVNGINGNTYEGMRSKYILEKQNFHVKLYGVNSVYNKRIKKSFLSGGLSAAFFQSRHFKTIDDLLGGEYWLDYDMFAKGLNMDPNTYQNNLDLPNKILRRGDVFGYDYTIHIKKGIAWAQYEYSLSKMDLYLSLSGSISSINREGFLRNGKFSENSKGPSATRTFVNYGVKGGISFKLNGRNFFVVNGAFINRAPDFSSAFISAGTRNDYINPLNNEEVSSFDISYISKFPNFKARVTYFNTVFKNQTYLRNYFHDEFNTIVNYLMTGINTSHKGIEIGLEEKITHGLSVTAVLNYGEYIYTNRPVAQAWLDNSSQLQFSNRTVYLKNYRIGNTPQTVAGGGIKYTGKKFLFAGININFFADMYVELNPDRRTAETLDKYLAGDPQWGLLIRQEKLPNSYTLDASVGKSFRVHKKHFLTVSVSVSNLTNTQKFRNSGKEQLRFDKNDPGKFPNKYSYAPGINYTAKLSFGF